MPGPVGMVPFHCTSAPSVRARSMTCAATARPSSRPALTSLGYCTPAQRRDCAAMFALSAKLCASFGNRYASTADAAPAAAETSHGYDGLFGLGTTVSSVGSVSLGRGRLYAYFASHPAMVAS